MVIMSDFNSTANLTAISFPQILTRATPKSWNISMEEKTIVSAFKDCGFSTYMISNQGVFGSELSRFTLDVDKVYNLNSNIDFNDNFDEHILPFLDSVFSKNDLKQFIVINLMGSHFRYNFRYPSKYNIFKPGFDGAFDYLMIKPSNRNKLLNIYDNSILYTDFILAEIDKRLESKNCLSMMMYLSDHGENIFDTPAQLFGHGSTTPTNFEIKIPFLIWPSHQYKEHYTDKILSLIQNKDKRLSTTNIFYSLLDAANIDCPYQNITKSVFNLNFKEDSIRSVLLPDLSVINFN